MAYAYGEDAKDGPSCTGGPNCNRAGHVITAPNAPVSGALAWSLACAAILSVLNGMSWNLMVDPHNTPGLRWILRN